MRELPPRQLLPPHSTLGESTQWRVTQWEWLSDEEDDEDGRWELRAHMPLTASNVSRLVPERIRAWVTGMTQTAIEQLEEIAEEEPTFREAAAALRQELAELNG